MQRNCHHGLLPVPLGHCSGPGFYRVHLCAPRDKGRASGQLRPWCPSPHLGKTRSEVARASPTNLICLDCPNVRCRFLICGAQPYLQWVWVCELCWSLGPLALWVLWFPGAPFMVPLSWRSLVRTLVCVYICTRPPPPPLPGAYLQGADCASGWQDGRSLSDVVAAGGPRTVGFPHPCHAMSSRYCTRIELARHRLRCDIIWGPMGQGLT